MRLDNDTSGIIVRWRRQGIERQPGKSKAQPEQSIYLQLLYKYTVTEQNASLNRL